MIMGAILRYFQLVFFVIWCVAGQKHELPTLLQEIEVPVSTTQRVVDVDEFQVAAPPGIIGSGSSTAAVRNTSGPVERVTAVPVEPENNGILVVGINGSSYRLDLRACPGGVVFSKPVHASFMCLKGFYLHREGACSSFGERVVGSKAYACEDFSGGGVTVQSLISMTSVENAGAHTVTLYDDPDLLTNLRSYNVPVAKTKPQYYSPAAEKGSPEYAVVVNAEDTEPVNIGGVCYDGVDAGAGAFRIRINQSIHTTTSNSSDSPCDPDSVVISARDGVHDASFDSGETGLSDLSMLDDYGVTEGVGNSLRKRGLHPGDTVVLDLKPELPGGEPKGSPSQGVVVVAPPPVVEPSVAEKPVEDTAAAAAVSSQPREPAPPSPVVSPPAPTPSNSPSEPEAKLAVEPEPPAPKESAAPPAQLAPPEHPEVVVSPVVVEPEGAVAKPEQAVVQSPSSAFLPDEEPTPKSTGPVDVSTYPSNGNNSDDPDDDDDDNETTQKEVVGISQPGDDNVDDEHADDDTLPVEETSTVTFDSGWPSSEERGRAGDIDLEMEDGEKEDDSWEDLHRVLAKNEFLDSPEPGTLEYDALAGGIDDVFGTPTSPHFESYVTLLKSQIEFVLSDEDCLDGDCSSFLDKIQPSQTKWYQLLSLIVDVVKIIVPEGIGPDDFFDIALRVFGYYARVVSDDGNKRASILDSEFQDMVSGLGKCAQDARNSSFGVHSHLDGGVFKIRSNPFDCDIIELETASYDARGWDEYSKSYSSMRATVIDFDASDPHQFLPPLNSRLNPKYWIFAELMWYSLQISYAFCFDSFADTNPNAYLRMQSFLIDTVFRDRVILEPWTSGRTGNVQVFETLLTQVQHSAKIAGASNTEDFERLLIDLDKISFVVHEASSMNHWMTRPNSVSGAEQPVLYGGSLVKDKGFRVRVAADTFAGVRGGSRVHLGDDKLPGLGGRRGGVLRRRRRDAVKTASEEERISSSSPSRAGNTRDDDDSWKERREDDDDESLKRDESRGGIGGAEIWDGLAYCIQLDNSVNAQGQLEQNGITPSIHSIKTAGVCS